MKRVVSLNDDVVDNSKDFEERVVNFYKNH
jgi:hypothetical protein